MRVGCTGVLKGVVGDKDFGASVFTDDTGSTLTFVGVCRLLVKTVDEVNEPLPTLDVMAALENGIKLTAGSIWATSVGAIFDGWSTGEATTIAGFVTVDAGNWMLFLLDTETCCMGEAFVKVVESNHIRASSMLNF